MYKKSTYVYMMKFFPLFMLFCIPLFSQNLSALVSERIIHSLIYDANDIKSFLLPEELSASEQLGISYSGISYKFLISNDIDREIKKEIINGNLQYDLSIDLLKGNYSRLSFSVHEKNYQKQYYFRDSMLISSPMYYSAEWKIIRSRYFEFHISDPASLNEYSMRNLDSYVDKISRILGLSSSEIAILFENKIKYFLCKDEAEIKNLTGFNTMGMYYLPYDYLITPYNSHYHELLHLLMNFKLKTLPLFTLPFFQEGFAVAYGGRGGKESDIFSSMAVYLNKSGFMNYIEILNLEDFKKVDASMSYPVSGLYNKFLIDKLGIDKYLKLYRKYSSDDSGINMLSVDTLEFPSYNEWNKFQDSVSENPALKTGNNIYTGDYNLLLDKNNYRIYTNSTSYLFEIKDTALLVSWDKYPGYISSKYREIFPTRNYDSQKYLITADSSEISVYNLFTNNLIAKYVSSFAVPPKNVRRKDGFYIFTLPHNLFDKLDLSQLHNN
jgi:hypothetical protein